MTSYTLAVSSQAPWRELEFADTTKMTTAELPTQKDLERLLAQVILSAYPNGFSSVLDVPAAGVQRLLERGKYVSTSWDSDESEFNGPVTLGRYEIVPFAGVQHPWMLSVKSTGPTAGVAWDETRRQPALVLNNSVLKDNLAGAVLDPNQLLQEARKLQLKNVKEGRMVGILPGDDSCGYRVGFEGEEKDEFEYPPTAIFRPRCLN